jgi:nitroimidazol reductase NimA-like FMN-containing flavoprotein (pyridoxamine 5'-phosphate oxidase superfamily)
LINEALELLTEEQCGALLASGSIGRVAVTVGGLPVILPVNYAYVDGDVVFRSGEETLVRTARTGAIIAFEIDGFDEVERRGWSVLIVGRATTVTDPDELDTLRQCGPVPWAGGERDHYLRLRTEMLSGRRNIGT